jgi:hypothetical protein
LAAVFGGGKKELKPLKRLPPAVFARLAGGPSLGWALSGALEVVGRLTRILPGFERSTNFWKGLLLVLDAGAALTGWLGCVSASDSESE